MDTKKLATALVNKYETRDPFAIARYKGFIIIRTPLKVVRGYYRYIKRCKFIFIDDSLPENEARFVCAHELGHCMLHEGLNRVFMDVHTRMVSSRYENEADRFAVDLLYSDDDLRDYLDCSISTIADCLSVSYDLAEYRMSSIKILFMNYKM